jgi:hypothetical protein
MKTLSLVLAFSLVGTTMASAQHPGPQPRPAPSIQTVSPDGTTTFVTTGEGHFESVDPFANPPGSNFLLTVFSNMLDGRGNEMLNTLPSTFENPYNLHDGQVVVSEIDATSPSDDLRAIFATVKSKAQRGQIDRTAIQRGIDILEGNPVPNRIYSGISLLHYTGPEKVKRVIPIFDSSGRKIGGNVNVHQIWFDTHIEADTALIDPGDVMDVPWTITYTVDVLNRGNDDFSPFVMYFDDPSLSPPGMPPMPHVAMDQTFFPMEDGTRSIFKIKMASGKYYNLTYHWGWRMHPPRVQVAENALKVLAGKTLVQWEVDTFGPAPRSSKEAKLAAIAKIGELSPAKQMWMALREALSSLPDKIVSLMERAQVAFDAWFDRTKLPPGVKADPNADLTLFYVNNTIYGSGEVDFSKWTKRPATLKVTLLNGDHFVHGYINVDFGGSRGWENLFQSTTSIGGSGCWFTFGRVHWWMNAGGPFGLINVPEVSDDGTPGLHKVEITFNYEPSRRLRFYQFDPFHHDVAVYSLH